ncbi:fumarylacetoacetate hydrolase family protein [Escherichia coli]
MEMAFVIGKNSLRGFPVKIKDCDDHIYGYVMMNDWSARDIQ